MKWLACALLASALFAQPAEPLSPPALGLIDPTFQPTQVVRDAGPPADVVVVGDRIGVYQTVARADGRASHLQLVWLKEDGTLDSTVNLAPPAAPVGSAVRVLKVEADRQILISIDSPGEREGETLSSLRRLQPDGSIDPSFSARGTSDTSARFVRRLDGGYALIFPPYPTISIRGVTRAGADDPLYGGTFPFNGSRPASMHAVLDEAGRILLAVNHSFGPTYPSWEIVRLDANGGLDPTFTRRTRAGYVHEFALVPDGIMYVAQVGRLAPPAGTITLGRLKRDGTDDATWRDHVVATPSQHTPFSPLTQQQDFRLTPDGGALLITTGPGQRYRLERIGPNGIVDRNYFAEFTLAADAGSARLAGLYPLRDGRAFAFGTWDAINGERRSHLARLTPDRHYAATRVTNVSARGELGPGAPPLTLGFALRGAGTRTILARAVGPTLAGFGIRSPLADPSLTVMSGAVVIASNDNWTDAAVTSLATLATQAGAFPLGAGSRDAAWTGNLGSGAHAVQTTTRDPTTGTVLGEWYDIGAAPADFDQARLVNFSILGFTSAAERALTAGFTVTGTNTKRLLVRAAGPALAAFGVSGAVANPQLEVYAGAARVAANDDWGGGAELATAFQNVGAFAWPPASNDAALVLTLPPGAYTVRAQGPGTSTGMALIEIYELP